MISHRSILAITVASLLGGHLLAGEPVSLAKQVKLNQAEGKSGFYIGVLGGLVWEQAEHIPVADGSSFTQHYDTTWGVSVPVG
jgi:hypothetical protein